MNDLLRTHTLPCSTSDTSGLIASHINPQKFRSKWKHPRVLAGLACFIFLKVVFVGELHAQTLNLKLRSQEPANSAKAQFCRLSRQESWPATKTAVIVCDMWDSHHCVNAVRRVQQLAPRIDEFTSKMRSLGATVIHAPSSCTQPYQNHPARVRAQQVPLASSFPENIDSWCDQIATEQPVPYPLDQSAGGEDDDLQEHERWAQQLAAQGRNPRAPWLRQIDKIRIDAERDFISDSGTEIWSILQAKNISQVMLVGVHTNMCVLGRPFGLRRLAQAGKQVVLVRDLTDTMYDPRAWPYANHFTGTDLIISHIERYVCPTISSDQVLGGKEFRFAEDHRMHLLMIIADDEYKTEENLPDFAARHLSQHFRVSVAQSNPRSPQKLLSLEDLESADAILVSARRQSLPEESLTQLKDWVRSGRPVIGIRTASHAFSSRGAELESGLGHWPEFDKEVLGGNYAGHYGNEFMPSLRLAVDAKAHPIVAALGDTLSIRPGGSLYKTVPLSAGTTLLISGSIQGSQHEAVAWTNVRADGGRSFYTSLGHAVEFQQSQFQTLLSAGIHWACNLPLPTQPSIENQNARYAAGKGKQRP
jgi:type 1 glutamine amidotransferase/nicotinamidase-related amidase